MREPTKQNLQSMALNIMCVAAQHRGIMQQLMETLNADTLSLAEKLFGHNFVLTQKEKEYIYNTEAGMTRVFPNFQVITQSISSISSELEKKRIIFDVDLIWRLISIFCTNQLSFCSVINHANRLKKQTLINEDTANALTKEFATTTDPCNFMFTLLTTRLCDGYERYQKAHAAFVFLCERREDNMNRTNSSGALSINVLFPAHAMTKTLFCNPFEQKEEDTTTAAAVAEL